MKTKCRQLLGGIATVSESALQTFLPLKGNLWLGNTLHLHPFGLKFDISSWSLQCLAFDFLLDTLIHVPFHACAKLPSVILEEGAECVCISFMKPHSTWPSGFGHCEITAFPPYLTWGALRCLYLRLVPWGECWCLDYSIKPYK